MSNDNYVGLHGRSPFEGKYQAWRGKEEEHAVPEHWEDLNRGICPWCGRTVTWDEQADKWVLDDTLTVLVVTPDEWSGLVYEGKVPDVFESMFELNRPFEEEG